LGCLLQDGGIVP